MSQENSEKAPDSGVKEAKRRENVFKKHSHGVLACPKMRTGEDVSDLRSLEMKA